jgi:hypothetical protein
VMLLGGLLVSAQVGQSMPAPPAGEISVIGTKLRKLQLDLEVDGKDMTACRIKVSSGDPFVDAAACSAARVCVPKRAVLRAGLMNCINDGVVAAVARERAKEESRNAEN